MNKDERCESTDWSEDAVRQGYRIMIGYIQNDSLRYKSHIAIYLGTIGIAVT